jgi:hypothetical protein
LALSHMWTFHEDATGEEPPFDIDELLANIDLNA